MGVACGFSMCCRHVQTLCSWLKSSRCCWDRYSNLHGVPSRSMFTWSHNQNLPAAGFVVKVPTQLSFSWWWTISVVNSMALLFELYIFFTPKHSIMWFICLSHLRPRSLNTAAAVRQTTKWKIQKESVAIYTRTRLGGIHLPGDISKEVPFRAKVL